MRRYSPVIILIVAIGCVFTLSKVYKTELDALHANKKSNANNSDNKDIALSSIKESFDMFLNFDANLKKKKEQGQGHIKNNNSKKNESIISQPILDTVIKNDTNSSPIFMLEDIIKNENLISTN